MAKPKPASDKMDKKLIDELKAFAEIREAIGDPEGKLMQPEVVAKVQEIAKEAKLMNLLRQLPDSWSIRRLSGAWLLQFIPGNGGLIKGNNLEDVLKAI